MKVTIRLTRHLYQEVIADLRRPHPFATERVGFLFGRIGNANTESPIVLLTRYKPLADDRYINDPTTGARIDSQAIRSVMQDVLDHGEGAFHTHMHEWPGKPAFSWLDRDELPRLIPSFQVVGPKAIHGLFLLSEDECISDVWLPGSKKGVQAARVSIVGYPLHSTKGEYHEQ